MTNIRKMLLCVSCAITALLWGCSGTETGNPHVISCASAVFDAFDSTDVWYPENHLLYGVSLLDPGILMGDEEVSLAKKTTTYSSLNGDTIIWIDTVILEIPVVIIDSILNETVWIDTVTNQDSSVVYLSRNNSEYFYVNDTVTRYETTYVERKVYDGQDVSKRLIVVPLNPSFIFMYMDASGMPSYSIRTGNERIDAISQNFTSIIHESTVSVSQQTTRGDTLVYEAFFDADGDKHILQSNSGTPKAALSALYIVPQSMEISVSALFDGGEDERFSTTGDNRITSFKRRVFRDRVVEIIVYDTTSSGLPFFWLEKNCRTGAVDSLLLRYEFAQKRVDHRQSAVSQIRKEILYRSGSFRKLEIVLDFYEPAAYNLKTPGCFVRATMHLSNGRVATLEGRLDPASGQVMGIYKEDNISKAVQIFRSGRAIYTDLN